MAQWTEPGLWGLPDLGLSLALVVCRLCDPGQVTLCASVVSSVNGTYHTCIMGLL